MKRKVSHKRRRSELGAARRRKSPVVRGPQGELFDGRTPRLRFVEGPVKRFGNPFFAVRVPREVLAAFKRKVKNPQAAVRAYMSKVSEAGE